MGTPTPPNPGGNQCASCWGVGKEFGPVQTPRVITVTLSGLQPGEEWDADDEMILLTPHLLFQTQFPCTFEIRDDRFQWHINWEPHRTGCCVTRNRDNASVFQQGGGAPCIVVLVNFNDNPVGVAAFSGHFSVQFGDKV